MIKESSTRIALLPLLVVFCLALSLRNVSSEDDAKAVVKRNPIVKVDARDQVSSKQLFSSLWQIKGVPLLFEENDPSIARITANITGRTFVTHASDISSDYDMEVRVSGSSEDAVGAVGVDVTSQLTINELVVGMTSSQSSAIVGQYLLVEVRVRTKNSITRVTSENDGDVVVLDNVLATMDMPTSVSTQSEAELALVSNSVAVTTSTTTGFEVVEDAKSLNSASTAASTTATRPLRSWMIEKPDTLTEGKVHIDLSLPGSAVVSELAYYDFGDPYAGRVMVIADDAASLKQVEVVSTHSDEVGETIEVRLKASAGGTAANFTTLIALTEKFQVSWNTSSKVEVHARQDLLRTTYRKREMGILVYGKGSVFVSDPEGFLVWPKMDFDATGSGDIQVDVGRVWTQRKTGLRAYDSNSINWFGEILHSNFEATPLGKGKICIETKFDLHGVDAPEDRLLFTPRVSYTGRSAFESVQCEKRALPERKPAMIGGGDSFGDSRLGGSTANGSQDTPDSSTTSGAPGTTGVAAVGVVNFAVFTSLLLAVVYLL